MLPNQNFEIGTNIRTWRVLKGFKQAGFAKLINISKSTLSKIENDKQPVSLERLQKIAICLNIKTTDLFKNPIDLLPPHQINNKYYMIAAA